VRHPSLGEEELEVLSHSLDKEGNIEQYEVNPPFSAHQHGQTMTLEASEVTITKEQIHKHPPKKIKVTSKNEMMSRSVGSQKKSRDKIFLARSRDNTIKKVEQDNVKVEMSMKKRRAIGNM